MTFSMFTSTWEGIATFIVGLFQSLVSIFYTAPTTSGGAGSLTFVGYLAIVSLGLGLVFKILGKVQGLIKMRG